MQAVDTRTLTSALTTLEVDRSIIDRVVAVLTETSDDLRDGGFATQAEIPPAAFGQRDTAQQLGVHHSTAHQVVQATIDALGADLLDVAAGATQAATSIIGGLGAAGARGAGAGAGGRAGAGAGGGRGGSEDRRSRIEIDVYDTEEDWSDDEGVSPRTLD